MFEKERQKENDQSGDDTKSDGSKDLLTQDKETLVTPEDRLVVEV